MRVLLFGTFDRFHPGHAFVLAEAAKRGDVTVVVALDENVKLIKGRLPSQPASDRAEAIKKFFPPANVILGDSGDFFAPVRSMRPDIVLLGYDQKMPPGVSETDFSCPVERLPAFEPLAFKSSKRRFQK